jgi:hypothetical protein
VRRGGQFEQHLDDVERGVGPRAVADREQLARGASSSSMTATGAVDGTAARGTTATANPAATSVRAGSTPLSS